MKVYEVTDQTGSRTNDQMLAKANQIKAKLDKAEANNDIMGAFSVGPEMYDLMQNDMVPKMLKAMDIMFIRLDKMARKNKQDPKAQEILKQLPKVKAQIDAQKRNMMKSGVPLGRQDVGEGDILKTLGPAIRAIHMKDPEEEKRRKKRKADELASMQKNKADKMYTAAIMDLIQSNKGNKEAIIAGFRDMIKNMDGFSDWYTNNSDSLAGKTLMKAVSETTTAGSVATSAQPMGQMISRSMYNKDGTMKNGLDHNNVLGGPAKPKRAKKRRI